MYLAVIDEFGVTAATVVILSTIGGIASGLLQYAFGVVTRYVGRPTLLGGGGLLTGAGMAAQAVATGFGGFAIANVVSRIGGAPQHPVGNALLAEQFPPNRIGTAIAAHVAGGNVGTVVVGATAALAIAAFGWQASVAMLGVAAIVVAIAILAFVRERSTTAAAQADGPVRAIYRRVLADRDLRWLFTAAVLGGGSRGLGVLNIFVPLYLDQVVGLDAPTIGAMYAVLLVMSVPGPARRGLAVGPDRPAAGDRRRVPRRAPRRSRRSSSPATTSCGCGSGSCCSARSRSSRARSSRRCSPTSRRARSATRRSRRTSRSRSAWDPAGGSSTGC